MQIKSKNESPNKTLPFNGRTKTRETEFIPKSSSLPKTRFYNHELGPGQGSMGIGEEKTVLDGKLAINIVESEYYGLQIQWQLYTQNSQPIHRRRSSKAYDRIEGYGPLTIGSLSELIDFLLEQKYRLMFKEGGGGA